MQRYRNLVERIKHQYVETSPIQPIFQPKVFCQKKILRCFNIDIFKSSGLFCQPLRFISFIYPIINRKKQYMDYMSYKVFSNRNYFMTTWAIQSMPIKKLSVVKMRPSGFIMRCLIMITYYHSLARPIHFFIIFFGNIKCFGNS